MALVTGLALASMTPAMAQAVRVEASVLFGWTFSDGVSGQAIRGGDGQIYDRLDPKDSASWGFDVGGYVTEQMQVGFLFGQQMSTLQAGGTATRDIGDLKVNTYHGYVAYNLGDTSHQVRPYLLIGLGATNYGSVDYTRVGGQSDTIAGETQLSTTWGAGVKMFPSLNVGVRFGAQWPPTYIKSDAVGTWCDPYWGCYVVGDAQYSNQWNLGGGISFRF